MSTENTKYYAVLAADLQGPAYGTGTSPEAAYQDAINSGFETGEESDAETCIEITEASYIEIGNGNPDAWCVADEYVSLVNPWSKSLVDTSIADIINNGLDAYPWPENVREKLDGMVDTDEEWVIEAVKMMGPELAGEIIIGS